MLLDPGGLASFSETLQFLATAAFAGLLVISLATHFLAQPASLAKFAETTDRFLDRLARTNP
jgi:hypothetical protein